MHSNYSLGNGRPRIGGRLFYLNRACLRRTSFNLQEASIPAYPTGFGALRHALPSMNSSNRGFTGSSTGAASSDCRAMYFHTYSSHKARIKNRPRGLLLEVSVFLQGDSFSKSRSCLRNYFIASFALGAHMVTTEPIQGKDFNLNPNILEIPTIVFTTPDQQEFTIGIAPGTLGYVYNNNTGEEFEIYISQATTSGYDFTTSEHSESSKRDSPDSFDIRLFQRVATPHGTTLKMLGHANNIQIDQEYLEPSSGILLKPISKMSLENSHKSTLVRSGSSGCCIDCGSYISCGTIVRACGQTCMKDTPFSESCDRDTFSALKSIDVKDN